MSHDDTGAESLPRCLVISTTRFETTSATGSALSHLFAGWPIENLAQIHHRQGALETDTCRHYYYIEDRELAELATVDDAGRSSLPRHLRRWIEDFDPELVYFRTIDEPDGFRRIAAEIHHAFGTPVVTHTMDDWLNRLIVNASTDDEQARAARARADLDEVVALAANNLVISEPMATAMAASHNRSFQPFANSIDWTEWENVQRTRRVSSDGVFRVRYAGGLAPDMNAASVADVAYVCDILAREGRPVQFEMSSARWWEPAFDADVAPFSPSARHVGFFDRPDYLQFLVDADLLVLPINFDDTSLAYVRYSMSNKAPDYMAAGVPILAYGPLASATISYAAEHGWARLVSERSPDELARTMREMIDEPDVGQAVVDVASSVVRQRHDATTNRRAFRSALAGARVEL